MPNVPLRSSQRLPQSVCDMLNLQIDMINFWWQETFCFHYTKETAKNLHTDCGDVIKEEGSKK